MVPSVSVEDIMGNCPVTDNSAAAGFVKRYPSASERQAGDYHVSQKYAANKKMPLPTLLRRGQLSFNRCTEADKDYGTVTLPTLLSSKRGLERQRDDSKEIPLPLSKSWYDTESQIQRIDAKGLAFIDEESKKRMVGNRRGPATKAH